MKINKEFILRLSLLLIALFIISYNIYLIYLTIIPFIENFISYQNLNLNLIKNININLNIYLILFGFILYFISRNWKNSFKYSSKFLISIALFFLSLSIFLFTININAGIIKNSIQPSLDNLVVEGIEIALNNIISKEKGQKLNLILSENSQIRFFYVKNLTLNDVNFILKNLNIKNSNSKKDLLISKIIISTIYEKLLSTNKNLLTMAIPISTLNSNIESSNYDLNSMTTMNFDILNLMPINQNSYLKILISSNELKKTIIIGDISSNDLDLIWKNLNLKKNISLNTKNLTINALLSLLKNQLKTTLNFPQIPISSISSIIPFDLKNNLNKDFLSKNISKRISILNDTRFNCLNLTNSGSDYNKQFCDILKISDYNYLMKNLENISKDNNFNLSKEILLNSKNFNSLEKIQIYVSNSSKNYILWFFSYLFLMIISIFSLIYHFKFNKKLYSNSLIYLEISKMNLIKIIPIFLIIFLIYYFLSQNIILNFIGDFLNFEQIKFFKILISTPIYLTIINIFWQVLIFNLIYLILSLGLYFFFFLKIKSKNKLSP